MIACVDVDYRDDHAVAACVLFADWTDDAPVAEFVERVEAVAPYVPGEFYKRELPCLLAVLGRLSEPPEVVVVDGYVWLGEDRPGLGAHLYEALGRKIAIVGVAKTEFRSAKLAVPVRRGEKSSKPLFVTAAGVEASDLADRVRTMHGAHRLPTLLRRVDALCREA